MPGGFFFFLFDFNHKSSQLGAKLFKWHKIYRNLQKVSVDSGGSI